MAHVSAPAKQRIHPTAHLVAEEAAFRRKLPKLLKRYRGQYVALRHGRVIGHGPDDGKLACQVYDRLGKVPFFIAKVQREPVVYEFASPEAISDDDGLMARQAEFRRKLPQLLKRYAGQYVALYRGRVVGHDPDCEVLGRRMFEKLGDVPFFIGKVQLEPDVYELPSPEVVW